MVKFEGGILSKHYYPEALSRTVKSGHVKNLV